MSAVTFLCLLQRNSPTDMRTFKVQVSKDSTVGELKEVIMNNRPDLNYFAVEKLQLFKVDIPNDSFEDDLDDLYYDREGLLTTRCVKDYWTNIPEKNIHIVVEPPQQVIFIPVIGAPEMMILSRNEF